jgi:hypothetical protein
MQATSHFHDGVTNRVLQEADVVLHDAMAFHPTHGMFNADADGGDSTIGRLLGRGELPPTRFLLGLDTRDAGQDASLEAHILIETTSGGQAIALQISQACIVGLPCIGGTQEAHLTGLIDDEEVFERVAPLLTTVILLLLRGIPWAMEGSLRTIMPTKGDVAPSFVCFLVRSVAHSPAVRAGSSSCCAKA